MTSLAAIHVAKKQLGMAEDDYRALLRRVTGAESAKDLSEGQRGLLLEEFRRLGFAPAAAGGKGRRKLTGKYAPKLQALWIAGWNLGIIRNADDKAMLAFIERQTKISDTRFLRYPDDAAKAIEALKAWLAREGGVDWQSTGDCDGRRVACAQAELLWAGDSFRGAMLVLLIGENTGKSPHLLTEDRDWIPVMNELGKRIRAAKALRQAQDEGAA